MRPSRPLFPHIPRFPSLFSSYSHPTIHPSISYLFSSRTSANTMYHEPLCSAPPPQRRLLLKAWIVVRTDKSVLRPSCVAKHRRRRRCRCPSREKVLCCADESHIVAPPSPTHLYTNYTYSPCTHLLVHPSIIIHTTQTRPLKKRSALSHDKSLFAQTNARTW